MCRAFQSEVPPFCVSGQFSGFFAKFCQISPLFFGDFGGAEIGKNGEKWQKTGARNDFLGFFWCFLSCFSLTKQGFGGHFFAINGHFLVILGYILDNL